MFSNLTLGYGGPYPLDFDGMLVWGIYNIQYGVGLILVRMGPLNT
jgi:hypothetical protein